MAIPGTIIPSGLKLCLRCFIMKHLTEPKVVSHTITWLSNNGYKNIKSKMLREHGVDLIANTSYNRFVYIECKGHRANSSQRDSTFLNALGQIVTRMDKSKFQKYGLSLPNSYRPKLKRLPWRFAKKNKLFVLLINESGQITKYTWKELKESQHHISKPKYKKHRNSKLKRIKKR